MLPRSRRSLQAFLPALVCEAQPEMPVGPSTITSCRHYLQTLPTFEVLVLLLRQQPEMPL